MEFEINGIKYVKRGTTVSKKSKNLTSLLMAFPEIMMASLMISKQGSVAKPKVKYNEIDIVKEFELIQKKQSRLSRMQRDQVVHYFHRQFKKAD